MTFCAIPQERHNNFSANPWKTSSRSPDCGAVFSNRPRDIIATSPEVERAGHLRQALEEASHPSCRRPEAGLRGVRPLLPSTQLVGGEIPHSGLCLGGGGGDGRGEEVQAHPLLAFDSQSFGRSQCEKQSDVTCPQILPDQHNQAKELQPNIVKPRLSKSPPHLETEGKCLPSLIPSLNLPPVKPASLGVGQRGTYVSRGGVARVPQARCRFGSQ